MQATDARSEELVELLGSQHYDLLSLVSALEDIETVGEGATPEQIEALVQERDALLRVTEKREAELFTGLEQAFAVQDVDGTRWPDILASVQTLTYLRGMAHALRFARIDTVTEIEAGLSGVLRRHRSDWSNGPGAPR